MLAIAALTVVVTVHADIGMHTPRGSNNKLNEVNNNVRNDNRLFDSQTNAKSGYQYVDRNCGVYFTGVQILIALPARFVFTQGG